MALVIQLVLSAILVASSVFADEMEVCYEMFNPENFDCCENAKSIEDFPGDMKSCIPDSEEMTCDNLKCILEKKGALKGDNIDEDVLKTHMDNVLLTHPDSKDIIERIKRECLGGKYSEYPPEDCPPFQLLLCAMTNANMGCEKWKPTDKCNKVAESAKKCRALVDN